MKKLLTIITLIGGIAFTSAAQSTMTSGSSFADKSRFSIGLEAGLPVGGASGVYNAALGGSLKYETPIAAGTLFTISGGYTSFLEKAGFGNGGSVGFVPLKAGIKYYLNQGFYVEGQAGATFYVGSGGSYNYFAYSPGLGFTVSRNFDIGVRYEGWVHTVTVGQIAFRAAYNFQ
jgi:hypothetical protein